MFSRRTFVASRICCGSRRISSAFDDAVITTIDGANEWAAKALSDLQHASSTSDNATPKSIFAGIFVAKNQIWDKENSTFLFELSLPDRPVGVFAFDNLKRLSKRELKKKVTPEFPAELKTLLELTNLRACGLQAVNDMQRLRKVGVYMRGGKIDLKKHATRLDPLLKQEGATISIEALLQRYIPERTTTSDGQFDTALHLRLLAEIIYPLSLQEVKDRKNK